MKKRIHQTHAFTVLEMLTACLLLSILSIMLFQALDNVTKITAQFQGKGAIYQDTRFVVDQITRDLQQAISYNTNFSFHLSDGGYRGATQLDFIATIDNNRGAEEVEVHYYYDGYNQLWKSLVYHDSTDGFWDIDAEIQNWIGSPGIPVVGSAVSTKKYDYCPILDGVDSFNVNCWKQSPPNNALNPSVHDWSYLSYSNMIPAYVEVNLQAFDRNMLRRWKSASNIRSKAASNSALTNSVQTFNSLVQIPLSNAQ